jgi:hypothetical protein
LAEGPTKIGSIKPSCFATSAASMEPVLQG